MIEYTGSFASIRSIETNPLNYKYAVIAEVTHGSFEGKKFQVKFCNPGHRHNINEFISHYIARLIEAPVLDGAFLKLDEDELERLKQKMKKLTVYKPIDTNISKKGFFFGVEWMEHLNEIKSHKELMPKVKKTSNANSFYSLYPLDQILKNEDRHLQNHLISKQGKKLIYNVIDFDRIFSCSTWINTTFLLDNFGCLKMQNNPRELEFLYSLVDNATHENVVRYAVALSRIQKSDIDDMCEMLSQHFRVSKAEVDTIRTWFMHRKELMYEKCMQNTHCFANVTQQRLPNVYRYDSTTKHSQL